MTPMECGRRASKLCSDALTGRTLAIFVFGAALAGSPALAQEAPKPAAERGETTVGEATHVDLSAAPTLSLEAAARILPPPEPRGAVTEEEFEARKAAAGTPPAAAPAGPPAPPPSGQGILTPGASFAFRAQSESGNIAPPDMAVAVSPSFVVQVVNSSIAVYNKTGALQSGFPKLLSTFFPGTTGDVGDPRAFYDWQFGRFVVVVDDFTGGTMHIAASATSDPTGVWHMYTLAPWGAANCRAAGHACADFPQLGFDDDTIFLGVNFFTATGSISDYMLLLPKANIYAGTGFGFNYWFNLSWGGTNVDTVQPVIPLSQSEHPRAGFAINSFNINFGGGGCTSGCKGLVVWAFSNNLQATGSPGSEFSAVLVNTSTTYTFPAQANGPGCPRCIDTNDVRIFGTPAYHAGVISASLNTNGPDHHSHALWFQVQPTLNDNDSRCTGTFVNQCPQVTAARILNEDCFFCGGQGTNGSTFFGTLVPNIAGDLTMVFNYADDKTFLESAYVSRRATQAVNSMHDAGFVLCGGAASYSGRSGDYTATAGDLTSLNQDFMWFSAMNASAGGNWGTCVGANAFTSPTQP
jgi:hypothetical protein